MALRVRSPRCLPARSALLSSASGTDTVTRVRILWIIRPFLRGSRRAMYMPDAFSRRGLRGHERIHEWNEIALAVGHSPHPKALVPAVRQNRSGDHRLETRERAPRDLSVLVNELDAQAGFHDGGHDFAKAMVPLECALVRE